MPVIRISNETMQRLKTWAEPLKDSAESTVRKVLDAAERMRDISAQTHPAAKVPETRAEDGHRGLSGELSQEEETELVERKAAEPFVEHLFAIPAVGDDADFARDSSEPRAVSL